MVTAVAAGLWCGGPRRAWAGCVRRLCAQSLRAQEGMNRLAAKILRNIPSVMSNPRRAWRLLSRRLVPMGVVWTDPDAYQVVGSRTFGRAPRVALTDAFPGIAGVDVRILRAFDRSLE